MYTKTGPLTFAVLLLNFTGLSLATDSPKESATVIVADLRDGSKLVGEVVPQDLMLELNTDAVGKLRVSVNRVDKVEFAKKGASVTLLLTNGDRLKGEIQLPSLKLRTLLGPLTIPIAAISKLQVHAKTTGASRILGQDDWQSVPFPANCDWPGDHGVPSSVNSTGITLRGQPLRSVRSYPLPVEIECEFTLLEPLRDDGHFKIMVMPPHTPEEILSVRGIELHIDTAASARERTKAKPIAIQYFGSLRNARTVRALGAVELTVGEPNRLKVQVGRENWVVTLNDETFTLEGVKPEYDEVLIQLWNWQPSSRWSVRDFSIRSATGSAGEALAPRRQEPNTDP